MITFEQTMGGFRVESQDGPDKPKIQVGYIDKEGFFTSPADITGFVRLSPDQLRIIANEASEFIIKSFFSNSGLKHLKYDEFTD